MESPLWTLSQVFSTAVIFDNQRKGVLFQTKCDSCIYKYKKSNALTFYKTKFYRKPNTKQPIHVSNLRIGGVVTQNTNIYMI